MTVEKKQVRRSIKKPTATVKNPAEELVDSLIEEQDEVTIDLSEETVAQPMVRVTPNINKTIMYGGLILHLEKDVEIKVYKEVRDFLHGLGYLTFV